MFRFSREQKRTSSKKPARAKKLCFFEHLEDRTVLSGTPIGTEQLVNTTVAGDQRLAMIGSNPKAGQSVVVWASAGEDGSGDGVYAQRYDLFGSKVGSPFRVNTFTSNNQTAPAVAMDSLGSFVVTWQSTGQDGSGDGIYARSFGYDGTALTAEFRVNTTTAGNQQAPTIWMNDVGEYAIAWQTASRDGSGNAVAARVFRSTNTAVGNDFQVNQFTAGNQQAPSLGMDNTGAFVVAWQSAGQDGTGDAIVARRYNRDGVALANEFVVNQFTTGNQSAPSVASNSNGSFVVAWQSAGQDGSGDAIVARQYDAAGTALANEFVVNQFTVGNQSNPSAASDAAGGFVIAWQSALQDGNSDAVVVRNYTSAGVNLGPEIVVNSFTTGAQNNPSVVIDALGDYTLAWQSPGQETGGGTSLGAFVRRYNVANDAPVMRQVPNQAIDVGGTVSFAATARDADGSLDTLTYSLLAGAPAGMTIDATTGQVTWNTSTGVAAGRYFATVRATDAAGAFDTKKVAITLFSPGERTALDDYVNAIDPTYGWDIRSRVDGDGFTKYNIRLTSGTWRTAAEVNNPLWQHWLVLYVPDVIRDNRAFLFIDAGNTSATPPTTQIDPYAGPIAATAGLVMADLLTVPNQPLTFAGETSSRSEDSIIAYSWRKYLETGDPTWPVNLAMTRAAMRAMDAVMDFMGSPVAGNADIDSFIVAGASKRGWTTWLASATDPRVSFAIPVVADLLNMEQSFAHHYAYYNGTFSAAVKDYVNEGILDVNKFGTDGINSLLSIVDPYTYKNRLTLPKFMIYASGDEFFVPDSWQFYYDDLPGPKWIRYIANTGHGISDPNLLLDAFSILIGVSIGYQIPSYSFSQLPDGTIEVQTSSPVVQAKLWQATNTNAREFRNAVVGNIFTSTPLTDQGGGVYRGNVPTPAQGWTAYMVELSFQIPTGGLATVSTGVYIKGPPTNRVPVITSPPDMTVNEGAFSLPFIATEPDPGQTLSYSLDTGAPAGLSINPTTGVLTGFWNDQLGLLPPVTVIVQDNGSPIIKYRDTFRITVVNGAPTASVASTTTAVRGEVIPFTFSANDPSPVDQAAGFTYQIDWNGDGTVDQSLVGGSSINANYSFANLGSQNVRVRAIDKDGGVSDWSTQTINVNRSKTVQNPFNASLTDLWIVASDGDDAIIAGLGTVFNPLAGPNSVFVVDFNSAEPVEFFEGITGRIVVDLRNGNDIFSNFGISVPVSVFGGDGDDTLVGTAYSDTLDGGNGSDWIFGSSDGSTGPDSIRGGDGIDLIFADEGNDTIDAGNGDDVVLAGGGDDSILGGQGRDLIIGGTGADTIRGGLGGDILIAGSLNPDNELSETILDEWWSGDSYSNRVNHLLGLQPGGLNTGLMLPGENVLNDSSVDTVYGEDDDDLFFVDLQMDLVPDLSGPEVAADLSS
jgi:PhoPQ-activated pathogenicity-related protein